MGESFDTDWDQQRDRQGSSGDPQTAPSRSVRGGTRGKNSSLGEASRSRGIRSHEPDRRIACLRAIMVRLPDVATILSVIVIAIVIGAVANNVDFLRQENAGGIPRAVPLGFALSLALVSLRMRSRQGLAFRFLACYWALGALCFSRPAVMELGIDFRGEPLVILASIVLFIAHRVAPSSRQIRRAMLTAISLPVVIGVVLLLPASRFLDVGAYTVIAIVALVSMEAARNRKTRKRKTT